MQKIHSSRQPQREYVECFYKDAASTRGFVSVIYRSQYSKSIAVDL